MGIHFYLLFIKRAPSAGYVASNGEWVSMKKESGVAYFKLQFGGTKENYEIITEEPPPAENRFRDRPDMNESYSTAAYITTDWHTLLWYTANTEKQRDVTGRQW
jgi:hypothetical protein